MMQKTTADENMATVTTESGALSSPELRSVYEELAANTKQTEDLVRDLSEEQLAWRPAPNVWSIADCLAHLNMVNSGYYMASITRAIADGRERGILGTEPFRHGMLGNLFVRMVEPPVRFRVPAPRAFVPPPDSAPMETVKTFIQTQEELQRLVRAADGVDLGRVKVTSPINKRLKFTLGQAFRLLAAHERRHLWQARGVRESANFPHRGGKTK